MGPANPHRYDRYLRTSSDLQETLPTAEVHSAHTPYGSLRIDITARKHEHWYAQRESAECRVVGRRDRPEPRHPATRGPRVERPRMHHGGGKTHPGPIKEGHDQARDVRVAQTGMVGDEHVPALQRRVLGVFQSGSESETHDRLEVSRPASSRRVGPVGRDSAAANPPARAAQAEAALEKLSTWGMGPPCVR
jgi:hypothetical protein